MMPAHRNRRDSGIFSNVEEGRAGGTPLQAGLAAEFILNIILAISQIPGDLGSRKNSLDDHDSTPRREVAAWNRAPEPCD